MNFISWSELDAPATLKLSSRHLAVGIPMGVRGSPVTLKY